VLSHLQGTPSGKTSQQDQQTTNCLKFSDENSALDHIVQNLPKFKWKCGSDLVKYFNDVLTPSLNLPGAQCWNLARSLDEALNQVSFPSIPDKIIKKLKSLIPLWKVKLDIITYEW